MLGIPLGGCEDDPGNRVWTELEKESERDIRGEYGHRYGSWIDPATATGEGVRDGFSSFSATSSPTGSTDPVL